MAVSKRAAMRVKRHPIRRKFFAKASAAHLEKMREKQKQKPICLLLASFGFNAPIVREKFAKVIPQDASLSQRTCLVIPYAGFDAKKTFEREKQGLVAYGFDPGKIKMVRRSADIAFRSPDYIYVPGGDPFKLLHTIRQMGILYDIADRVRSGRTVYIGASAGACIACESIEYVTRLEDNNVIDNGMFHALGLTHKNILCHYDYYSHATLKACQEVDGRPVVTINDDQLLMFADGVWKYIGEEE